MTELPVIDPVLLATIKNLMNNIKNNVDQYNSMEHIADLVDDNKLAENKAYKPLLQSICTLLQEKGYMQTAKLFLEHWSIN
jgi:hypothetical protein